MTYPVPAVVGRRAGLRLVAAVLLASVFGSMGVANESQENRVSSGAMKSTPPQLFDELVRSRDAEYTRLRIALFADADGVAYLRTRFEDSDRVTAFIARQLHSWAIQRQREFETAESELDRSVNLMVNRPTRSATTVQPGVVVAHALEARQDGKAISEFLLLRVLMQPETAASWILPGLQTYFAKQAVTEPAVWIRIALSQNDENFFEYLVDYSLKLLDKGVSLNALNHERNRSQRLKATFPQKLEDFRAQLLSGR